MIPLAIPDLTGNEKKYLDDCIDTTYVSSVGKYVTQFEEMLAAATGAREKAVATSSGTTGLHAALTAVGVSYNDLVILPTFTFIASANAIKHSGADPWLMDIREDTWCLDPDQVGRMIKENCEIKEGNLFHKLSGRRVAALMPVYTLGNIPDMDAFQKIAGEYSIPLVADAACAIGARFKEREIGELADLTVFSFNGNKTITCGGGGAIVGCQSDLLAYVRHLTTTARVWPDYDFDEVGFNYRMTNIQAAVGVAQLERLDCFVKKKRYVRKYYAKCQRALQEKGIKLFSATEGSSCWFSGIVLPEGAVYTGEGKFSIVESAKGKELGATKNICLGLKEYGIEARPFWKPVHLQKPYMKSPCENVAISEKLWQRIITLPCSTNITEDELSKVICAVTKILQ